jgi:hypothetical protein
MKYLTALVLLMTCNTFNSFSQKADTLRKYTLFHAVPREKMREMQTDRPDVTESAYTVDAGHFQVESDAIKWIHNKTSQIIDNAYYNNLINLKAGLTNSTDLQLVMESYVWHEVKEASSTTRQSGFGNLTIRLKQNLWGNSSGKSALAIMPYVSVPTSRFEENKQPGGGLIIPFALKMKNDWSFGTQTAIDFGKPEPGQSFQTELLTSLTFGKSFNSRLDAFIEANNTFTVEDDQYDLFLNGGLVYSLTDNFNIDAGINYGITKSSDKVYFIGFSFRY